MKLDPKAMRAALLVVLGTTGALWASVSKSVSPEPAPTRILVKFKPTAAASIESALPLGSMEIDHVVNHSELPAFLRQSRIHKLRPLYRQIVEEKKRTGRGGILHAQDIQAKFPHRQQGKKGPFNPPDLSRTYVLEPTGVTPAELQALADQLSKDPAVEYAHVEHIRHIEMTPNDPRFQSGELWGLNKISCPAAWDLSTGAGVVVADLDTGIDPTHADLQANIVGGWNFYTNSNVLADGHGHGTHTAGTIAAVGNNNTGVIGVAFQAKLMPIKVCSDAGGCPSSRVAQGLQWAADHGAQVANMSFGGYSADPSEEDALAYAYSFNMVLVAAAGNSGFNLDTSPHYPASSAFALAVAATDGNDALAGFSNFGNKIDVAAPGVSVLSTWPGDYAYNSGTSMATPHVAGTAALILAKNPGLSNEVVRQIIRASADDVGAAGWDSVYGYGRLNAFRALQITGSPTIPILTSLSPAAGLINQGNTTITLTGTNFVPTSVFQWRYQNRATTYVNANQLTAIIPAADFGSVRSFYNAVRVFTPGVGPSNEKNFIVVDPSFTTFLFDTRPASIAAGSAGFTLWVDGSNFMATSTVRWNGTDLPTTFVTLDTLQAAVPAALVSAPGNATITVFSYPPGRGDATNSFNFTIKPNLPPTVSAGPDQTITLPANVLLAGTTSDDGLPFGVVSTTWSMISAPAGGSVIFGSTYTAVTSASFSLPGTYGLRLDATDSLSPVWSSMTVTANPSIPMTLTVDRNTYITGQAPLYTITGAPPNSPILWTSTKNGLSTGETNASYGQVTDASGHWSGLGSAWTSSDTGVWTKQASISGQTATSYFAVSKNIAPPAPPTPAIGATRAQEGLGVFHWGTDYQTMTGSKLVEGSQLAQSLGVQTISLALTPRYTASDYPGENFGAGPINTLTDLAKTPAFQQVFGMPFKTYVLVTYTFTDQDTLGPTQNLGAEQGEIADLVTYLLQTYPGTGKTFIIKNWEGDNALTLQPNGTYVAPPTAQAISKMINWLNARHAGLLQGRTVAGTVAGVTVSDAVEFNRVSWPRLGQASMLSSVIPSVQSDYLSYSSYESINTPPTSGLYSALQTDVAYIRGFPGVGSRPLFIGEYGFSEGYFDDAGDRTQIAAQAFLDAGIPLATAWVITDSPGARGMNLVRSDGSHSPQWTALRQMLQAPQLSANPTALTFTAGLVGSNPPAQNILLSDSGLGLTAWTAASDAPWLSVGITSGLSGQGSAQLIPISVTVGALAAGTHTGHIQFSGPYGVLLTIPVTLTITVPNLGLNPSALTFAAPVNGADPPSQDIQLVNTGPADATWTAVSDTGWLSVSPASGGSSAIIGSQLLVVSVTKAPLAPGTYTGHLIFTDQAGASQVLTVTFVVQGIANVTLTKSADVATAKSGDIITFTIQYHNIGAGDASNLQISDDIPAGTTLVPGSITGGGSNFGGPTIYWTLPTVIQGGSGNMNFQVKVN